MPHFLEQNFFLGGVSGALQTGQRGSEALRGSGVDEVLPLVEMGAFETKVVWDWCGITESTF